MLQLIPKSNKDKEHFHYDLGYILVATKETFKVNFNEVDDIGWFPLNDLLSLDTFKIVPEIYKLILAK